MEHWIFKPEISLGDIVAFLGFIVAAIGLFLTLRQLREDSKRKRAEFIVSVFNQYVTDPDTAQMFYLLEYDKFEYKPSFHRSDEEKHLDKLLSYFEMIATLYDMGVVSRSDLELIKYQFVRVYENAEIQKYFQFLDNELSVSGGSFRRFRNVAALLLDNNKMSDK
ncbi:MAG TPA: hypothetical protein VK810_05070 [Dongiaceae bacterium]|nr:hypothetical protein [Dongiaceae bacterium]